MESEVKTEFVIRFEQEEVNPLSSLIKKLHDRPQCVGFLKKDFTDEEKEIIAKLYSLFDYE